MSKPAEPKKIIATDQQEKIIDEKMNFHFGITTRVNLIDYDLLCLMKKAGLSHVDLGIETGSPNMLKLIDKDINQQQIIAAAKLCRKMDIDWNAFIMIGFPDETEEDIKKTFRLIKRIKPHNICLSIFTPYPGTKLYERAKELALIPDHVDWSKFSHQSPENHFVKNIPKDIFKKLVASSASKIDKINELNYRNRLLKVRIISATKHPLRSLKKIFLLLRQFL